MKILAFAIVILVLVVPSTVSATKPTLVISSSSGAMGTNATFSVTGLSSNAPSKLKLDFTTLSSFTTNSTGGFTGIFTIPYVPIGDHRATASTDADPAVYALKTNGTDSNGIAYDPAKGRLYVGDFMSNKISVIDTFSNKTISVITVGPDPRGMAFDSANDYLYVAHFSSNTVTAINTNSNQITDTLSGGAYPVGVAYDPKNGYLYVTNVNSYLVTAINTTSNQITDTLSGGASPAGIVYDPKNDYLYVASFNQPAVYVIDTVSKKIISDIAIPTRQFGEFGVTYSSAKNFVYVADGPSGIISVINATSNKIIGTIPTGDHIEDIFYDESKGRIFVTDRSDTVKVLKIDDNTASAIVTIPFKSTVGSTEGLIVKPVFSSDHSDACSILQDKVPEFESTIPPGKYILNHVSNDLNSNYTRTTAVYYDGTKLIVTIYPNASKNNGGIYGGQWAPYGPRMYSSYSPELAVQTTRKINVEFGTPTNFTLALTNAGNKTVTITHPFSGILGTVINLDNGSNFLSPQIAEMPFSGVLEMPNFESFTLKPRQSSIQYSSLFWLQNYYPDIPVRFDQGDPYYSNEIIPGNYTIASFARFLGDVNGTCTMIYLWSQPIDLAVYPEGKVPEFPFAIPVLLMGIASTITFYRMKFK